ASALTSSTATGQPSSSSHSAVARPMPDAPPVTTADGFMSLLLDPLADRDVVGDGSAAHVEDAAEPGAFHLDAARFAHEPHRGERRRRDAGGADRMALGLEPARGVGRQAAGLRRLPFERDLAALATLAQPRRLIFDQFGDGEAVMRLDEGEVVHR